MFIKGFLLFIVLMNVVLGIFVLVQNSKAPSNRIFFLLSFIAAIWTFSNYMSGIDASIFWLNSSYAFGTLVIATGLLWTFIITDKKLKPRNVLILSVATIIFFICSYTPGFIAQSYEQAYSEIVSNSTAGNGILLYLVYYITIACLILKKLFLAKNITQNPDEKAQIKPILCGALIALFTSFLSTTLPLIFNITIWGIDAIGFFIFLLFIAYAITKHRLFNIRVIAIEIVIFLLWVTLIVQIFTAETHGDLVISIAVLATTIIFGILLIRSTLNEIRQQEHIEKLSTELRKAYAQRIEDSANKNIADRTTDETEKTEN